MESMVDNFRTQLETQGEYVTRANISSGWFAVFPDKWYEHMQRAKRDGRDGPNLIVYRTTSGEARDHHVISFAVARDVLVKGALTHSDVNGSDRWNLTLRNGRLHVTHRPGYIDVSAYYGAPLIVEATAITTPPNTAIVEHGPIGQILEGIAHEMTAIARSRSRKLREGALRRANGICEACGTDFSSLFGGAGLRALQVHHKQQIVVQDVPKLTTSDDLAVVCANCHAIIHADPKVALAVEVLRMRWAEHSVRAA